MKRYMAYYVEKSYLSYIQGKLYFSYFSHPFSLLQIDSLACVSDNIRGVTKSEVSVTSWNSAQSSHKSQVKNESKAPFMSCASFRYHLSRSSYFLLLWFPYFASVHVGLWRIGSSPGRGSAAEQQPAETGAVQESSQAISHWIPGGHLEGNDGIQFMAHIQ